MLEPFIKSAYAVGAAFVFLFWTLPKKAIGAWKWIRGQSKAKPTHGAAGFASLEELKRDGHLTPGGFLYGVQDKKRVFGKPESCVHFFAKRGEGKSATMSANIRYLSELPIKPDLVINDPASEQYRWNWPYLKERGYELLLLDLDDPDASRSKLDVQTFYNPMAHLHNSTEFSHERDVASLANLLVPQYGESTDSTHFIEAAVGAVKAMIDWEYQSKGSKATVGNVVRILTTAPDEERDEVFKQIKAAGSETAKAGINVYLRVGDKERGSFNSTIGRKLQPYSDKALATIMKPRGKVWTWEDVFTLDRPVAVFIVGGLGGEGISGAFARLVIGQCIDAVKRYHNQHKNGPGKGRLPKPLRVFIDEADTLGFCRPLSDAVTQLRKADVNTFCAWQSRSQIYANYGGEKKAEPFLGGCDLMVTGGITELSILRDLAQLLGRYTAHARSESKADHGTSEGSHETPRQLADEYEIRTTPWGHAIVLADRKNIKVQLPYEKVGPNEVKYL